MAQPVFGQDGDQGLRTADVSTVVVTAFTPFDMRDQDICGIQLATQYAGRAFVEYPGDAVNHTTKTWTLANGGFVGGDVGATLIVTNTVSSNGSYVISSRTNAHVIVTSTGPSGDETFGPNARFFIATAASIATPLAGTWAIQVSNDYAPPASAGIYGQPVTDVGDATWSDITSSFSPSINAVTAPGNQFAQATLAFRALRVLFSSSAGTGSAKVIYFAKSYS